MMWEIAKLGDISKIFRQDRSGHSCINRIIRNVEYQL